MVNMVFGKVATVQMLVNTAASIAMIVDNIVIGQYLGVVAIAAYGAVAPLLLLLMAISQVLSTGGQMNCSEALGKGDMKQANGAASLTMVLGLGLSSIVMLICFAFSEQICLLLGAKNGSEFFFATKDYLLGNVIGMPAFVGMLMLVPFIQLDGNKKCVVQSMWTMTAVDAVGDVAAVQLFDAGMFGIGLASSISYYAALLIFIKHFASRKGILRPSLQFLPWSIVGRIFFDGAPAALQKVLRTLLSLTLNHMLLIFGGAVALGIFTLVNSIVNLFNSVGQGMGAAALLLASIYKGEGDKQSLLALMKAFVKRSLWLNGLMFLLVLVLAPELVRLFAGSSKIDMSVAKAALIFGAADFIVFSLANCWKNFYQGVKKRVLTYVLTVSEAFLFSALAAWPLGKLLGLNGFCLAYAAGDLLTLVFIVFVVGYKNKALPSSWESFLMSKQGDFAPDEKCYRCSVQSQEDVGQTAQAVTSFVQTQCPERQQEANKLGLCVEQIVAKTINHAFKEGKDHLEVDVTCMSDKTVLRIRDDGERYNPVQEYEELLAKGQEPVEGSELWLALKSAKKVSYMSTLGLNNLVIEI